MPIQDAIELGLVDGYLDVDQEAEELLSAGGSLRLANAAGGGPGVEALLERYEAAVKAGTMQEVPEHPVNRESAQEAENAPQSEATEDPRITENREICEHLIADWRLQAAIDLERARSVT